MKFDLPTTAALFIALIAVGVGGLIAAPMMGTGTILTMVLPSPDARRVLERLEYDAVPLGVLPERRPGVLVQVAVDGDVEPDVLESDRGVVVDAHRPAQVEVAAGLHADVGVDAEVLRDGLRGQLGAGRQRPQQEVARAGRRAGAARALVELRLVDRPPDIHAAGPRVVLFLPGGGERDLRRLRVFLVLAFQRLLFFLQVNVRHPMLTVGRPGQ